jgi:hypothetical protein
MSDQSAIDQAVKRLASALDALDAAVERRREGDRREEDLAHQVQSLAVDAARARRLETTNREIAGRLDAAIASIQAVLDTNG